MTKVGPSTVVPVSPVAPADAPTTVEESPKTELQTPIGPTTVALQKAPDLARRALDNATAAATKAMSESLSSLPAGVDARAVNAWLQGKALPQATEAFMWAAIATYAEAGERHARVWAADLCDHLTSAVSSITARLHADPKTRPMATRLREIADYMRGKPNVSRESAIAAALAVSHNAPQLSASLTQALHFVASTKEGDALVSFVDGAFFGRGARSHGFAATAGEAASSIFPLFSQLGSARDLVHTLRDFRDGKPGADLSLILSALLIVPSFEFMRRANVLSEKQLHVAHSLIGAGADEGLAVLRKALAKDAADAIEAETRALNVARTEIIARIENALKTLPPDIAVTLTKVRNGLSEQLEPDDFVGALREIRNIGPVWSRSGKQIDHREKAAAFLDAVVDRLDRLRAASRDTPFESATNSIVSAVFEFRKRAISLLEK